LSGILPNSFKLFSNSYLFFPGHPWPGIGLHLSAKIKAIDNNRVQKSTGKPRAGYSEPKHHLLSFPAC